MRKFHLGTAEQAPPHMPVHLEQGEGSLGWLLYLVQRRKLDLIDVPLAPLAAELIDYFRQVQDLDEGADTAAALAYLVERKAERLLAPPPEPEEEPEPPEPLPDEYRELGRLLKTLEAARSLVFFRRADPAYDDYELPPPFGALPASELAKSLRRLLERASREPLAIPERPRYSIKMRMIELLAVLNRSEEPVEFESVLEPPFTRLDVVLFFMAVLELLRLGEADAIVEDGKLWLRRIEA